MTKKSILQHIFSGLIFVCLTASAVFAQTTVFSYQGKLNDGASPANGNYQLQFKLFDSVSGGVQIGATIADVAVAATQGVFNVKLDFGASVFTGANRFLEIAVRRNAGENYVTLSPREQIASSPYSIRTLSAVTADNATNADQLGGVPASEYVTTTTGATNFIQNTTTQQPGANFNIDGTGTTGNLNVNSAFSLNGSDPPPTAPAGQGRIYFDTASNKVKVSENGTAFVDLVGASGVNGSGTVNSLPLWSAGTTIGNSLITQSGSNIGIGTGNNALQSKLTVQGNGYGLSQTNGTVTVGTFLSSAAGGSGWFGTRTNHPLNFFTNDGLPQLTLSPDGSAGFKTGGSSGFVTLGSPNGETGITINGNGTTRADIRYDGSSLKLLTSVAGIPQATNGIVINQFGNVGIGIAPTPVKLFVQGGVDAFRAVGTGQGVFGQSTGGGSGVIGFSNTTSSTGGAVAAFNTAGGNAIYAAGDTYTSGNAYTTGNIRQGLPGFGLVKAMVRFRYDIAGGFIVSCYNSVTDSSSGQCGFSFNNYSDDFGLHTRLNLGFTVNNRFISATGTGVDTVSVWDFPDSNTVDILTRNISASSSIHEFYLFIY